jgi:hypothetical protein
MEQVDFVGDGTIGDKENTWLLSVKLVGGFVGRAIDELLDDAVDEPVGCFGRFILGEKLFPSVCCAVGVSDMFFFFFFEDLWTIKGLWKLINC